MLDLSPTKLLIVFVVAVVLLGPKRLPRVARELGAGWRKLRELHRRVDSELRQSMPDLPTSQEIVRFARSPITMLNRLAALDEDGGADGLGALDDDGEDGVPDGVEDLDAVGGGAFSDATFTETGLGGEGPGEDGRGAAEAADRGASAPRGNGSRALPRAGRVAAPRAPRLAELSPLPPGPATDDPHLN